MQPEESPLLSKFQYQSGIFAQLAHLFYTVCPYISMPKMIHEMQFDVVKEPPHPSSLCSHVSKYQSSSRTKNAVYAVEEILDVWVVVKTQTADDNVE